MCVYALTIKVVQSYYFFLTYTRKRKKQCEKSAFCFSKYKKMTYARAYATFSDYSARIRVAGRQRQEPYLLRSTYICRSS